MPKRITLIALLATISLGLFSQRPTLELTFTAENNGVYVQLDSIKVMNRTQGGDTVLYWPDTMLSIYYVGIPEISKGENSFQVFQNYPNPVATQTTVSLYVPEKDKVSIIVTDILGRMIVKSERVLDKGKHSFRFTPGNSSLYFFTARWQGQGSSIKILQAGFHSGGTATLEYTGSEDYFPQLKAIEDIQDFSFSPGDELLYIGYANGLESGMLDAPQENQAYTFQFATNIPCPGTPTVEYEGQVYNTIQIFSQCWLKENLNVGTMIPGSQNQSNNGTIEKYCYNNDPNNCITYGGLYQWDEMMQYTTQQGAQGICPPGWHLPTDEEWKVLEGAVDSQYGIGDNTWDDWGYRGNDAGTNLKTASGWYANGNGTDLFGFSGLPGGDRYGDGYFGDVGIYGIWWTSTEYDSFIAWFRYLIYYYPVVYRDFNYKDYGFSARCLRDEIIIPTIELTFTAVNNDSYVQLDSIKVMNRTQGGETMIYWPDTTLVVPGELAFTPGDELLFIGYANGLESGMLDSPEQNTTYTFQFATNIPCPGMPTVEYEGQVYNTIQIFSQCWLKENLNVGTMIPGNQNQSNNGILEKYCYNNQPDSCTKYGGLYQWSEMMQYTTQQGARGICPPGWHLPTDEEWKVLEGAVDSQYGIGDPEWDLYWEYRGYDAGTNLKTTSGWYENGNGTDLFGFAGLPGGLRRYYDGYFHSVGTTGYWWTSTEYNISDAWRRYLGYNSPEVYRIDFGSKANGFSARCLRDEIIIPTIELTFTAVNNDSYVQLDSIKVMNRTQGGETMIYWPDTTLVVPGELAFTPGDELLFIGYANGLESGMLDSPEESTTYTFQFATNIPCPGMPTVEYEGQVYNTIQIFSQCWLKENLNVGTMISGSQYQSNNGTIEKYCYNNDPNNCITYGGLYQWWEMMQYTTQQGTRGICPPGWHLPTDEEWKILEGAVDSQYGMGDPVWDLYYAYRGYDAGTNLKTTSGWYANGNGTDLFGFSGLPGGYRVGNGFFFSVGYGGYWWTSTEYGDDSAWLRYLNYYYPEVYRYYNYEGYGFSARCLRDY